MRSFAISESSQVTEARRESIGLTRSLGFSEEDQGRVGIVVTELATNLIKHAGSGELRVGASPTSGERCIEILAIDRGPGMDVETCLVDGYSTAGSRGTGLGASRRQATTFEAFSTAAGGTVLHARVCAGRCEYRPRERTRWGAVVRPIAGELACGDAFAVRESPEQFVALMADGLGHGMYAAQASSEAIRIFERSVSLDADAIVKSVHDGLRPTRGAAIAVAAVDGVARRATYSGIGNIAGSLVQPGTSKRMVSNNGTAGHVASRIRAFQYGFEADCLLVLHSDGISSSWSLDRFPGLMQRDPTLSAAVLDRDFARARDDAAVLVARFDA